MTLPSEPLTLPTSLLSPAFTPLLCCDYLAIDSDPCQTGDTGRVVVFLTSDTTGLPTIKQLKEKVTLPLLTDPGSPSRARPLIYLLGVRLKW